MLRLPFGSNYVCAFLFVFVDILGLWALHRGLVALQAYYHFRAALRGGIIPLKRSRVPIVSGDLLSGRTRIPSLFVLAHIAFVGLCFSATFGVEGESQTYWKRIDRSFLTTVIPHGWGMKLGKDPVDLRGIGFKCREGNRSSLSVWPLAFNTDKPLVFGKKGESGRPEIQNLKIDRESTVCMKGNPEVRPIFLAKCTWTSDCDIHSTNDRRLGAINLTKPLNTSRSLLRKGFVVNAVPGIPRPILEHGQPITIPVGGFFARQYPAVTEMHGRNATFIIFAGSTFNNKTNNVLSWGTMSWENVSNPTFVYLRINSITVDPPFTVGTWHFIRDNKVPTGSGMALKLFGDSLRMEAANGTAQENRGKRSVTFVEDYSLVIYGFLALCALLLGPAREVIIFFVVRMGGRRKTELFFSDYDTLSSILQEKMESTRGIDSTGKTAFASKYVDDSGKERVGPYIEHDVTW